MESLASESQKTENMVLTDTLAKVLRPRTVLTRRAVLRSGIILLPGLNVIVSAATHFWDSRPASRWTADEIAELASKSPWAKPAMAQYRASLEDLAPQPGSEPEQGRGEARVGPCGLVPCGQIMPGQVTVIWESAQPIREAIHPVIPPQFNGRYVISIRGLEGTQVLDKLEAGAELSVKGRSPVQAGVVAQRNSSYLFGFSKELAPITANDKEVIFTVRTGPDLKGTLVRATFNPKEMMYRGALAL
jgi:hypothetical protein